MLSSAGGGSVTSPMGWHERLVEGFSVRVANQKGASWAMLLAGMAIAFYATNLIPAASAYVVWVTAITVCLIWYARHRSH